MMENTLVGTYYNDQGEIELIVHPDNDDFSAHQYEGLHLVVVDKKVYDQAPAINIDGRAFYKTLAEFSLPQLAKDNPKLAQKVQGNVVALDAVLAAEAQALADVQALAALEVTDVVLDP